MQELRSCEAAEMQANLRPVRAPAAAVAIATDAQPAAAVSVAAAAVSVALAASAVALAAVALAAATVAEPAAAASVHRDSQPRHESGRHLLVPSLDAANLCRWEHL